MRWHVVGTRFGIHVDPDEGLLVQGAEGFQLTWMDAKVGDWVVSPRRGKAVEINALWFNALTLLAGWLSDIGDPEADEIADRATQSRMSFNRRFWIEDRAHLYDVVDGDNGDDPSFRPNQIIAMSLGNPVLDASHWEPVLEAVRKRLVTPPGLRSLAAGEPDYKQRISVTCGRVTRHTIRDRLGVADRAVYQCLAARAPRRQRDSAAFSQWLWCASGRGRGRFDQRNSRRRAALHPGVASRRHGASRKCCAAS